MQCLVSTLWKPDRTLRFCTWVRSHIYLVRQSTTLHKCGGRGENTQRESRVPQEAMSCPQRTYFCTELLGIFITIQVLHRPPEASRRRWLRSYPVQVLKKYRAFLVSNRRQSHGRVGIWAVHWSDMQQSRLLEPCDDSILEMLQLFILWRYLFVWNKSDRKTLK